MIICSAISFGQAAIDSLHKNLNVQVDTVVYAKHPAEQEFNVGNNTILIYKKPVLFVFIKKLPADALGIVCSPFKRSAIKPLLLVATSSVLLLFADETVAHGVHQFSENIHLHPEEQYKDVYSIRTGSTRISILKAPKNLNTGIYQFGQGLPSLLIGVGLFTYGKIRNDYRAVSVANQLAESFILMGVGTQLLKRISGRQSPNRATERGGDWHLLPKFKDFQKHTASYDAFPSGHLATLMSTLTVFTENYPEIKWIKPVGYGVIGLLGYAMINNDVHWISDYPLALALGYVCARQVARHNRKLIKTGAERKNKAELSYTLNYSRGIFMPGITYKF